MRKSEDSQGRWQPIRSDQGMGLGGGGRAGHTIRLDRIRAH
ncbi:hypothetical protein RM844_13520 [Streptomyces sp. DSM 44915]|uniref:Uncharacterized protein n=1 Tax=Streptomyces chisholmiae TaxID=3075540 RepID=A0ABU2JS02_9ACTN|nr:hypothetical protein [Streptomyces sp. DSM 44915]MDT0267304.1 hypothetical protein [Streptomyces sp. DSM 44915]